MSYPSNLRLFRAWAKAMEEGANVKTPDYGKKSSRGASSRRPSRAKTLPRRKRRKRKNRRKRRNQQEK